MGQAHCITPYPASDIKQAPAANKVETFYEVHAEYLSDIVQGKQEC